MGSNHPIASTASGPQEGAQSGSGIPLPTQLCLELISPFRDTDPSYNLTPESL